MAGGALHLWNKWATQILVLLSLALQVVLILFAGIRRREASAVPTFLLWLAYLLADSTAIYTLGHISFSGAPNDEQLVAFWAPFLLLHLGGPDNITAYALEDSKLWLRHLQNLIVQVLGAAYVLYKHVAGGDQYILIAAILIFCVGAVKYGERTWALMSSNLDSIRASLEEEDVVEHRRRRHHDHFHPPADDCESMVAAVQDDEFYLRRAHSMFHVCKRALVDSWVGSVGKKKDAEEEEEQKQRPGPPADDENHQQQQRLAEIQLDIKTELASYKGMGMWTLIEMELSLMYDFLYTKAGVVHTWPGYAIRVVSSLATAASFLLFSQFIISTTSRDGHGIVDLAVSYTLLSGAFLLETASLLRALGSTWTYDFLCNTRWSWLQYTALCSGRWDRLRRLVKAGRGRLYGHSHDKHRSPRRWSGKIGQYNILHARSRCSRGYKSLLGGVASIRYKDWWVGYHYSGKVELSQDLKNQLLVYVNKLIESEAFNAQGVLRWHWGEQAFKKHKETDLYKSLIPPGHNNYLGAEFQEAVIIWHIATDVFIAKSIDDDDDDAAGNAELVRNIRTLSNYMAFLLVNRPYMLPGLAQSMLYRQTCKNLDEIRERHPHRRGRKELRTKIKEFFRLQDDPNSDGLLHVDGLAFILSKEEPELSFVVPRLYFSYRVAEKLHEWMKKDGKGRKAMLQLLLDVWKDFLVYAANRCSRESHAKKLSNGGELITILWLMTDFLHRQARFG